MLLETHGGYVLKNCVSAPFFFCRFLLHFVSQFCSLSSQGVFVKERRFSGDPRGRNLGESPPGVKGDGKMAFPAGQEENSSGSDNASDGNPCHSPRRSPCVCGLRATQRREVAFFAPKTC